MVLPAMWKKVVAPTVLVSLLWIAVSTTTSYFLNRLDGAYTQVLFEDREISRAAITMQELLWGTQASVTAAADEGRRVPLSELGPLETAFHKALAEATQGAKRGAAGQAEHDLIAEIDKRFATYLGYLRDESAVVPAGAAATGAAATETPGGQSALPHHQAYAAKAMELALAITKPCGQLFDYGQQLLSSSFDNRTRLRARIDLTRLFFLVSGPAIGIILGFRVARGLHQTISQISVTLRDASGNLQDVGSVEVHPAEQLGDLPGLHRQVQDVSRRIRDVVEELQSARREAVRAERLAAVGELAAGVAHELRNPLTSVKLLIQSAGRGGPSHALEGRRLEVVQNEIARMENTIQGLLDFARPPKLHRVTHNLRDTLDRALNLAAARAGQQHVEIHELGSSEPVMINGDPEQLDLVFLNLLLNGIEAMPAGGTLSVSLEVEIGPPAVCRVLFLDTGPGIDEAVMDRLFEPFVTNKDRGVGLGLAVSRRVIQEHGGRIEASNIPLGGARFAVELPLVSSQEVQPERSSEAFAGSR